MHEREPGACVPEGSGHRGSARFLGGVHVISLALTSEQTLSCMNRDGFLMDVVVQLGRRGHGYRRATFVA